MSRASFVLHSHFYQPPREDPWTDRVPRELSAAPFHDWNERVHAECYRPLTAVRVLDDRGRIRDIVDTLEWMSWDAGPTLLRWLAREQPATYAAFLNADARSRSRLGFGNALAAPYHHVILPLASLRDKVTEVRWGIADFRRRFARDPEGMWLPETAVDTETLEVLAEAGIAFTILAPHQVEAAPTGGGPGLVRLPSGRTIAVFVYDGPLAQGVAFGELLRDAETWMRTVTDGAERPGRRLLSVAVDGETFGHHHRFSDMALAATLTGLAARGRVRLENYASFLERNPAVEEVRLVEPSAWSCAHGVDRWRLECGCRTAPQLERQQQWRAPLREGLEELSAELHRYFEDEAKGIFTDPWAARGDYGAVLDAPDAALRRFVQDRAAGPLDEEGAARALRLLEIERDAMRMFTSCGWFFDDLAGLEPLQVLRYAAHALELVGPAGRPWEERLRARLAEAKSNDPEAGDGRRLWDAIRHRIGGTEALGDAGATIVAERDESAEPPRSDLTSAVRQFLRAPGPHAARAVVDDARGTDGPNPELWEAQSAFARGVARGPGAGTEATRSAARALGFAEDFFTMRQVGGRAPLGFVFGLHLHQPAGNFDHVFESHTDEVYLPFLERLAERELLPLTLHVSGPLLEWLERRGHRFLDLVGRLVADDALELLLSGFYEPVLPALSREERLEQIGWMREWLSERFGADATGLWLTERVWEPDLVSDLADAGVEYALVDDRHFLVAGFDAPRLHRPYRTESGGRAVSLLPIDEKLRYLIPFRPPTEIADYMRALRAADQPFAVLADDGEKFGGWPGTAEWVWKSGWLDEFLVTMTRLIEEDVVAMTTAGEAVEMMPGQGPAYLPSASYREMEHWTLPPGPALELEELERTLRDGGAAERAGRFVRGGHWRSFFALYAESNRMHRKAQLLSELCRSRGDPPAARRAIGRAQCNDAYWHGVFGGLYLAHLRNAVWEALAEAEALLREGEGLEVETLDVDVDGNADLWVHSAAFSCVVSPARGGAVTELTRLAERRNLADVLTRRWESYHRARATPTEAAAVTSQAALPGEVTGDPSGSEAAAASAGAPPTAGGMPSIHDLEDQLSFESLPPLDADDRTLTVERVLPERLTCERYARADYDPIRSWARVPMEVAWGASSESAEIRLSDPAPGALEKSLRLDVDGNLEISFRWDPAAFPPEARFAPELSLSAPVELAYEPAPVEEWRYDIRTVSKSERGAEETVQGLSITPLWPCALGEARLRIGNVLAER